MEENVMWELALNPESGEFVIPDKAQRSLREQEIGEDGPGTILRDFETLLMFIGEDGLKTTGKYHFLPQARLNELNERMSRPVRHRLKRPQQRSFPHLNGLYLLLRASGLGIGTGTPPSGRLTLDRELLDAWHDFNPTERYFTLLESWLVHATPQIIAERGRGFVDEVMWVSQKLRKRRTEFSDERFGLLYGIMQMVTAALMELFGWLRIDYAEPEEGHGVSFAAVERLAFGDAMVAALSEWHLSGGWEVSLEDRLPEQGVLKPVFQPYFPEWQRVLEPPQAAFREGTFTWSVSLGRARRQIDAPADSSLDELAGCILGAFDFDRDHLYCFEVPDAKGRRRRIACPDEEDATECTDETALGDLALPEGAAMKLIFDYGDWWEFTVKLKAIGPHDPKLIRPKVTAKHGEAPAQYGWED
jgi:hypothetical protein